MKKFKKILALVTALALVMSMLGTVSFADSTTVIARAEAVTFNGHTYQVLYGGDMTWEAMEAYCESLGGYLACITTAEEDAFLYSYVSSAHCEDSTLFGFSDAANEGTWVWVSGEETSYTNWGSTEPSDYWGSENYAHYYSNYPDGEWNDTGIDSQSNNFLIEWNYVDDGVTNIIPEITVVPKYALNVSITSDDNNYFYINGTTYFGSASISTSSGVGEAVTIGAIPVTACATYSMSVTDASGADIALTYLGFRDITIITGWSIDENWQLVFDEIEKTMHSYTFTMPASDINISIQYGTTEVHTWDEGEVITAATCGENGEKLYTCEVCGETKTEVVTATGHTTEVQNAKDATCTEAGYTGDTVCTVCGTTIESGEVIPATGHSYEAVVTAPTCTEKGYTTYTCSVCGDSYVADETEALGHSYVDTVTAPTCTEQGYTTHVCSVCGETYVDAYVNALGHSYVDTVTAPTCTEQGYTTHVCSACGETYVDTYTAALGHSYEFQYFTWANDLSSATATFKCKNCDDIQTVDATITGVGDLGVSAHIATVEFNGETYTNTQTTGSSLLTVSADYSAVNAAIAKANALNASGYSNFATVTALIESVNWNMNLVNQDAVNAYAEAIETAIANLVPLVEETVNITEPIEDSTTESEPEEEVSEPETESNPTTGIAISLLPMAIAALAAVSSKRK